VGPVFDRSRCLGDVVLKTEQKYKRQYKTRNGLSVEYIVDLNNDVEIFPPSLNFKLVRNLASIALWFEVK